MTKPFQPIWLLLNNDFGEAAEVHAGWLARINVMDTNQLSQNMIMAPSTGMIHKAEAPKIEMLEETTSPHEFQRL